MIICSPLPNIALTTTTQVKEQVLFSLVFAQSNPAMATKRLLLFIPQNLLGRSLKNGTRTVSAFSMVPPIMPPMYQSQSNSYTTMKSKFFFPSKQCLGTSRTYSSNSAVSSNKLEVNGINFHYERTGTGDHAVLLLPGALGCSETDFQPQINGLSKDKYTIIGFDPRGCGKSRPPDRDWPLQFYNRDAEDAAALMKKLGFLRYSILGWSDGGITGILLAGMYVGNVRKLIMWGANSYADEKDVAMYKAVSNIDDWSERMRAPFIKVYGEEYFRTQWEGWSKGMMNIFEQRNGDICIGSLPNVKCKTLIVNGVKDPMVPQEHPIFLQKHIPNCRTVDWPEGKHNLHLRFHKEFNALAEEFLDEEE